MTRAACKTGISRSPLRTASINVGNVGSKVIILKLQIKLGSLQFFGQIWHTILTGLLLGASVLALMSLWAVPQDPLAEVGLLLLCVAAGVIAYSLIGYALWWFCGRPREGAQAHLLSYGKKMLMQRRGLLAKAGHA